MTDEDADTTPGGLYLSPDDLVRVLEAIGIAGAISASADGEVRPMLKCGVIGCGGKI